MDYSMTKPCADCPFLKKMKGFTLKRLEEFASGEFPCHKTADLKEDEDGSDDEETGYVANETSHHCAGSLIFLEKRDRPHQMMRISERLGFYDRAKLDMKAKVR